MRTLLRGLVELVLPAICAACANEVPSGRALCVTCERAMPRFRGDAPPLLPRSIACASAVAYAGGAIDWIQRFKYPRRGIAGLDPAARSVLNDWILEAGACAAGPRPDLVIPIALHARRLRGRGFNPAAQLARVLARETGVRHDPTALMRVRNTASQTGLDRRARRRNVAGAFRARSELTGVESVWLVDDVVTTGSTAAEAARVLGRRGVREITVVCAARTPLRPGQSTHLRIDA